MKHLLAIAIALLPSAALAEQFTPKQMLDVMTKSSSNRDVRVHDAAAPGIFLQSVGGGGFLAGGDVGASNAGAATGGLIGGRGVVPPPHSKSYPDQPWLGISVGGGAAGGLTP